MDGKVRLTILPCSTASDISFVNTPGKFLAAVADTPWLISGPCTRVSGPCSNLQDGDPEIEDCRIDIWSPLDN